MIIYEYWMNMNEYDVMICNVYPWVWEKMTILWLGRPYSNSRTALAPGLQPIIPTNAAKNRPKMVVNLWSISILCQYSVTSATCDRLIRSLAGDVQQAVEHVVCHDQSDYHLWACGCTWTGYGVQLQSASKIFTGIQKNTSTHPRVPQKENVPLHIDICVLSQ